MKSNIAVIISIVVAVIVGTQADCPTQCSLDKIDPVCGSDGKLYYTQCHLEKETCGQDVSKVSWSDCKADCEKGFCTMEYSPRCGSNGNKYGNKCTLLWASCGLPEPIKEMSMDHFIVGSHADCPDQCPFGLIDPVCGSNGKLYYTECYLEKATCGQGVTKVPWSECKADCDKSICTLEYSPRCGANGSKYGNKCALLWASCGLPEPIKEVSMDHCS
uniref:Kazal-like domain-containing protein n=1 Tax=Strigamia maritima TaxID=126957 RepID=T1IJ74_STRMM